MLLSCTHKGCFSHDHHLLDPDTNEVFCLECGEAIKNVPNPTKSVLKSLGQIKRKSKNGLQYTCKDCGHNDRPLLKSLSGGVKIATCRKCGKKMDIHPSFIQAMSELEGYSDADDSDSGKAPSRPLTPTPGTTFAAPGTDPFGGAGGF